MIKSFVIFQGLDHDRFIGRLPADGFRGPPGQLEGLRESTGTQQSADMAQQCPLYQS